MRVTKTFQNLKLFLLSFCHCCFRTGDFVTVFFYSLCTSITNKAIFEEYALFIFMLQVIVLTTSREKLTLESFKTSEVKSLELRLLKSRCSEIPGINIEGAVELSLIELGPLELLELSLDSSEEKNKGKDNVGPHNRGYDGSRWYTSEKLKGLIYLTNPLKTGLKTGLHFSSFVSKEKSYATIAMGQQAGKNTNASPKAVRLCSSLLKPVSHVLMMQKVVK